MYAINFVLIGGSVWEANDFEEYINPIFTLTIFAGITITFISFILQNDNIFKAIELVAKESNFSKCSSAHLISGRC